MSAAKIIDIAVKTATIRELAHERQVTSPIPAVKDSGAHSMH